jgi:predicted ATPase
MTAVAPAETPLIERGRELELLRQAWLDAQGGHGRLILVDGASGIGKTRLLAELGAVAAPNPVLLRARGSELECDLAYGIVRQLLERRLLELPAGERAQAFAGPAADAVCAFGAKTSASTSGRQIDHGLYWLIANLAQAAPLILAVDDAQWTDPASRRFLGYLARRLQELPAVLVMAAGGGVRDYRRWGLTELAAGDDASRLELGPLSQDGTARLATALSRGVIGPGALLACHRSTGGNPFLIRELVFAAEQSGRPLSAAAVSELTEHGADSLTQAVMLRLGSLGADAIAVAAAVVVLDLDSQLHLVGALSGLDVGTVAAAADRLAGARILADTLPLSFAHPLLRGAVYGDLTAVKRERLHREAAQLLRDAGAPVERVAMQLLATEPSQDPEVAELLLSAAADATAVGAPASAARYLSRALREPPSDDRCGEVLVRLGLAQAGTDDTLGARSHLQAALDVLSESNARVEAGVTLARVTLEAEGPIEAVRALERAAVGLTRHSR